MFKLILTRTFHVKFSAPFEDSSSFNLIPYISFCSLTSFLRIIKRSGKLASFKIVSAASIFPGAEKHGFATQS